MKYIYLFDYVNGQIWELNKVASGVESIDDETCSIDMAAKVGVSPDDCYWMSTNEKINIRPITIYNDPLEKLYPGDETASKFLRYLRVQLIGDYNMTTEKVKIMEITKLSEDDYNYIQWNYSDLNKKYPKLRIAVAKEIMDSLIS